MCSVFILLQRNTSHSPSNFYKGKKRSTIRTSVSTAAALHLSQLGSSYLTGRTDMTGLGRHTRRTAFFWVLSAALWQVRLWAARQLHPPSQNSTARPSFEGDSHFTHTSEAAPVPTAQQISRMPGPFAPYMLSSTRTVATDRIHVLVHTPRRASTDCPRACQTFIHRHVPA